MGQRWILHLDMDAFYAAVEELDHPELRGKAVIVGGAGGRGVVSTANYEARKYGPRSAMPMSTALRLCPHAMVVPVRMRRYQEVSRQVFTVLDRYSPLVEPLSIDEAFLDLTGTEGLFGPPEQAARKLKAEIRETTGLTASVGIAPSKFLAKLGSDLRKPDGLVQFRPEELPEVLDPLPISRLWGAGPATLKRMEAAGLRTFGDVRHSATERLVRELGPIGEHFHHLAWGRDDRPVCPDREAKSISHEQTFSRDVADADHLRTVLLHQVEDVAYRLRRVKRYARTVTLKLRYGDFTTLSRSSTMPVATQSTDTLWGTAVSLFEAWHAEKGGPLRLIGMAAGNLEGEAGRQLSLFNEEDDRKRRLDAALDQVRVRFGAEAVRRRSPGKSRREEE